MQFFFTSCFNVSENVLKIIERCSRNSSPGAFLGKDILKICSKLTRECPWWAISIKWLCNTKYLCWNHTSAWVFSGKFAAFFTPMEATDSCRDGWNVRNCSSSHVQVFRDRWNVQIGDRWNVRNCLNMDFLKLVKIWVWIWICVVSVVRAQNLCWW